MIIVDTSVWADHFRTGEPELLELLTNQRVMQHEFVTGELAMGNPSDRTGLINALCILPAACVVEPEDFYSFVEHNALHGTGLGFVDAHLLASAKALQAQIWTRDKRLAVQANRLGLASQMG